MGDNDAERDAGSERVFRVEESAGADDDITKPFRLAELLARLVADAGNVISRETLMAEVWDEHWFGSTKILDFHIAALRRKIDAPDQPSVISTLRGVGFRYEPTS